MRREATDVRGAGEGAPRPEGEDVAVAVATPASGLSIPLKKDVRLFVRSFVR